MKKLFVVRDVSGKEYGEGFTNKLDAKAYRDKLNSEHSQNPFFVSKGPDHWRSK